MHSPDSFAWFVVHSLDSFAQFRVHSPDSFAWFVVHSPDSFAWFRVHCWHSSSCLECTLGILCLVFPVDKLNGGRARNRDVALQ